MKLSLKKLLINGVIGLLITAAVVLSGNIGSAETAADVLRILCDGFFVSGAMLLGFGGLVWCYNGGVTDGLGYAAKTLFSLKRLKGEEDREGFAEYRAKREAKAASPLEHIFSGLAFILIAGILLLIYNIL